MRIHFDSFWRDVRQALRGLRREKGFAATVLLTLALCLGANVVIFTVVRAVLLKPLPFAQPDQLVVLVNSYPKAGVDRAGASIPNYHDRRTAAMPAFAAIAVTRGGSAILGEAGSPDRVPLRQATPSFFDVLGVKPALGRFFTDEENEYGKSDLIVLTDGMWRHRFNGDPTVVGRAIQVNNITTTIIGVLPSGFRYLSDDAQMVMPMPSSADDRLPRQRHSNSAEMIARLAPGATLAQAQAQIDALNAQLEATDPYANEVRAAGFHTAVARLRDDHVASVKAALLMLQAGVLFLLLIGAVNLANLLLVRASARAKEIAVRQALGASRRQIAAQLVTETVVLALAGGGLGLACGVAGLRALSFFGADRLPLGATIALEFPVAAAAIAGSVVVGLLLALPLVWYNRHVDLAPVLQTESRSGTTSRATHRFRHALIGAQIALAFVLLAGAALLGVSFQRVLAVQPGFRPDHVLSASIGLPWANYREDKDRLAFGEKLLAEMRAQPGVKSAGLATTLPFTNNVNTNAAFVEGYTPPPGDSLHAHFTYAVAGDYFAALGVPLREGRFLEASDARVENLVCVVDEDFAHRYWPDGSALGHRVFDGPPDVPNVRPTTIVGVVGRVKQNDLADQRAVGAIYFPFGPKSTPFFFYAVARTAQAPQAAGPALRQAVLRVDSGLPLDDVKTMSLRMDESLVSRRSPMMLALIFASMALLLAAVGIYGVVAYAVAQRRREIGVRMALGALPGQILRQFLGLGVRLLVIGIALGTIGAWFVGHAMSQLLFGVTAADPLVLGVTAAVLGTVVLVASLLPSRRAARVSPNEALRSD